MTDQFITERNSSFHLDLSHQSLSRQSGSMRQVNSVRIHPVHYDISPQCESLRHSDSIAVRSYSTGFFESRRLNMTVQVDTYQSGSIRQTYSEQKHFHSNRLDKPNQLHSFPHRFDNSCRRTQLYNPTHFDSPHQYHSSRPKPIRHTVSGPSHSFRQVNPIAFPLIMTRRTMSTPVISFRHSITMRAYSVRPAEPHQYFPGHFDTPNLFSAILSIETSLASPNHFNFLIDTKKD